MSNHYFLHLKLIQCCISFHTVLNYTSIKYANYTLIEKYYLKKILPHILFKMLATSSLPSVSCHIKLRAATLLSPLLTPSHVLRMLPAYLILLAHPGNAMCLSPASSCSEPPANTQLPLSEDSPSCLC